MKRKIYIIYAFLGMTFTGCDNILDSTPAVTISEDLFYASKALPTEAEKAVAFHDNVLPAMDALRAAADDAETICGEDYWPLPSYSKMLYYV